MDYDGIERTLNNVLEDLGMTQWPLNARLILELLRALLDDLKGLPAAIPAASDAGQFTDALKGLR